MRVRSHGLAVGPLRRDSVVGRIPNSGSAVLPTITKPASRSRRTPYASARGTNCPKMSLHIVSGIPATARLSLIAIGTPANGRSSASAADRVASTRSASASAISGAT